MLRPALVAVSVAVVLFTQTPLSFAQAPDYSWTFSNTGTSAYKLTSASSEVYSGLLPVDNPTLDLFVGKRYRVRVVDFSTHPLAIIAKSSDFNQDAEQLSMGFVNSPFESDSGVAWTDDGMGTIAFTMTQDLANAMAQGGRIPGYRCQVHFTVMRGNFNISLPPSSVEHWDLY
jgi:hypothetical protein